MKFYCFVICLFVFTSLSECRTFLDNDDSDYGPFDDDFSLMDDADVDENDGGVVNQNEDSFSEELDEQDPSFSLVGYKKYCSCKNGNRKNDMTSFSDENDENDNSKKKRQRRLLSKYIHKYFHRYNLNCYCTTNHRVVRLLKFLLETRTQFYKMKLAFYVRFKRLIYGALGRAEGSKYLGELRKLSKAI